MTSGRCGSLTSRSDQQTEEQREQSGARYQHVARRLHRAARRRGWTDHEWFFAGDEPHAHYPMLTPARGPSQAVLDATYEATGAVIAGRRTYDFTGGWGGQHPMGVPVFVVTHEAPVDVPDGPTNFTFTDGVEAAVEQARQTAKGRDICVMGGASMADECLRRHLLDEIQIHLTPVIMGAGVRMFDGAETQRLEPISVVDAGDVVHLRYRVY